MNKKITDITELLKDIPSISYKQAERLAIQLIEKPELRDILVKITDLSAKMHKDPLTGLIVNAEETPNENKEKDVLLIIESNRDVNNILKKTRTNKSLFVLDMDNKRDFKSTQKVLDRLFEVVKDYNTKEILFLLSPSIESELMMRVIKEEISKVDFEQPKLTRLSMGIPFGGSIEFSDERTIREAMEKREEA